MKYYLIAGERSGDLHAANLVKRLKKEDAAHNFRGIGGDFMQSEGVVLALHYQHLAVMGFLEVLKSIFKIRKHLRQCVKDIRTYQPDAIIFVDFGGFNLRVARRIFPLGMKKFYYIPPKIWAWNQKRAHKIKKLTDQAFVILPFEEDFYRKFHVNVQYVGNPVLDAISAFEEEPKFASRNRVIKTNGIIAPLPGSRAQELRYALPKYVEISRAFPEKTFCLSTISSLPESLYALALEEPNIIPVFEDNYNLLLNAEAAIVTSGTATLETAIFEVPQIVTYEGSPISYQIAKRLVKVKYISLVNLIAGREVVKEFIQHDFSPANVIGELKQILENKPYRVEMLKGYQHIRALLGNKNASTITAKEIVESLEASPG